MTRCEISANDQVGYPVGAERKLPGKPSGGPNPQARRCGVLGADLGA